MQMRRWGRAEAKPMSRDLTAPRAEYLARVWGRLVAGYDRARDEAERERAADQARLVAGDYRDADEIATDDAAAPVGRKSYPPHQLGAVASFLKLTARRGSTDFTAETIAAATMQQSPAEASAPASEGPPRRRLPRPHCRRRRLTHAREANEAKSPRIFSFSIEPRVWKDRMQLPPPAPATF
jgi:hypothetical protein